MLVVKEEIWRKEGGRESEIGVIEVKEGEGDEEEVEKDDKEGEEERKGSDWWIEEKRKKSWKEAKNKREKTLKCNYETKKSHSKKKGWK